MFGDKIAVFKTPEEAQRTADAHLQDGYPNSAIINDGYRWLLIPMPVRWGKRKK